MCSKGTENRNNQFYYYQLDIVIPACLILLTLSQQMVENPIFFRRTSKKDWIFLSDWQHKKMEIYIGSLMAQYKVDATISRMYDITVSFLPKKGD